MDARGQSTELQTFACRNYLWLKLTFLLLFCRCALECGSLWEKKKHCARWLSCFSDQHAARIDAEPLVLNAGQLTLDADGPMPGRALDIGPRVLDADAGPRAGCRAAQAGQRALDAHTGQRSLHAAPCSWCRDNLAAYSRIHLCVLGSHSHEQYGTLQHACLWWHCCCYAALP